MHRVPIIKEDIRDLYLNQHLTMSEISAIYGTSRQTIHNYIKRYNIDTTHAEVFSVDCDGCGQSFDIFRAYYRKNKHHYCTHRCYILNIVKSDTYNNSRQGQRIARKTMTEILGRSLNDNEIVHHINSNQTDNDPSNLQLFENHSKHMIYHHRQRLIRRYYPYPA